MMGQTFIHGTRESNLLAAKQAVRSFRAARMLRHTGLGEDVIDVLIGSQLVERHVCHSKDPMTVVRPLRQHHCIEDLALYR